MKLKNKIEHILRSGSLQVVRKLDEIKSNSDRGDVPGWVLITVMTAGLVVAIWSVAGPELKSVLNDALRSVTTP